MGSDPLQSKELPTMSRNSAGWSAEYSLDILSPGTVAPSSTSHTLHSGADTALLGTVQPTAAGLLSSTGQVRTYAGATLLNANSLVTSFIAGVGNTGLTPTKGTALPKNIPQ